MLKLSQLISKLQHMLETAGDIDINLSPYSAIKTSQVIEFVGGCGDEDVYFLEVTYWAEFPRNTRGMCAFCDNDPVAELKNKDGPIYKHAKLMGKRFETCPVCEGRQP